VRGTWSDGLLHDASWVGVTGGNVVKRVSSSRRSSVDNSRPQKTGRHPTVPRSTLTAGTD
jgi:hypothetical protein